MNCNFNNIRNIIKGNKINGNYYDINIFSELPKDGTFIYKNGKKDIWFLLRNIPKSWKKIEE